MLTQDESPAAAAAAVSGTSRKLLGLLRKRLRQLLRITLVLVICVALAATALAICWLRRLDGLPDIGDPFDVAEFRAFRIPDEQNALILMRRAADKFTPMHLNVSMDDPRLRDWFEANRPLVERFIQAADQADGISGPEQDGDWRYYPNASNLGAGMVIRMTYIEGGRRAERGDMAGAWNCYRAILRMYVHLRRRERVNDRLRAALHHGELQQRPAKWAADPRTTIPQLRRALEEMIACRPRPEWDAFTLKREYLDLMQFLEGPVNPPPEETEEELTYRLGDLALPADLTLQLHSIKRRLARAGTQPPGHPLTLRQLAGTCGAPRPAATPAGRAGAIPRCTTDDQRTTLSRRSPSAGGRSRLSPQEVASWLVTTNDARVAFQYPWFLWPAVRQREQRGYRERLVLLASELYHRERGTLPPSEDALVGTYLESLPDDGSAELGDETTPTVSDSASSAQIPPK